MNFYQMNVYEIERYIINNSIEASTLTNFLLDKLKEVSYKYEQLTEVLERWDYREDQLNELKEEIEKIKASA